MFKQNLKKIKEYMFKKGTVSPNFYKNLFNIALIIMLYKPFVTGFYKLSLELADLNESQVFAIVNATTTITLVTVLTLWAFLKVMKYKARSIVNMISYFIYIIVATVGNENVIQLLTVYIMGSIVVRLFDIKPMKLKDVAES